MVERRVDAPMRWPGFLCPASLAEGQKQGFPGQLGAICDWHAYTSTADPGAGRSGPARRTIMPIEGLGCDNRQAAGNQESPSKQRAGPSGRRAPEGNTAGGGHGEQNEEK